MSDRPTDQRKRRWTFHSEAVFAGGSNGAVTGFIHLESHRTHVHKQNEDINLFNIHWVVFLDTWAFSLGLMLTQLSVLF